MYLIQGKANADTKWKWVPETTGSVVLLTGSMERTQLTVRWFLILEWMVVTPSKIGNQRRKEGYFGERLKRFLRKDKVSLEHFEFEHLTVP